MQNIRKISWKVWRRVSKKGDAVLDEILLYHGSGEVVEYPQIRKTKYTTHQISFHTLRALNCLTFERSEQIHD